MSEAYIYIDKVTFDYSKKNETRRKRRAKILLLRTGFRTLHSYASSDECSHFPLNGTALSITCKQIADGGEHEDHVTRTTLYTLRLPKFNGTPSLYA